MNQTPSPLEIFIDAIFGAAFLGGLMGLVYFIGGILEITA